jgi:hypothetical protein
MTRRYTERRSIVDLIAENRRLFLIGAGIVVVLLLAVFGVFSPDEQSSGTEDNDDDDQTTRCVAASGALVSAIESGLTVSGGGSLSNAYIVRSDDFDNAYFVAARINGEGMGDSVGVWSTNDPDGGGSIFSADAFAAEFSDWGDGPGFSPSDDGFTEAEDCAAG